MVGNQVNLGCYFTDLFQILYGCSVVATGVERFGITIAYRNLRDVYPITACNMSPSLRCTCQSSGRGMVIVSDTVLCYQPSDEPILS